MTIQNTDTVRWHAHDLVFNQLIHAHPYDPLGHNHNGYYLVATRSEASKLVDNNGNRLLWETTPLEELHASRFDGTKHLNQDTEKL